MRIRACASLFGRGSAGIRVAALCVGYDSWAAANTETRQHGQAASLRPHHVDTLAAGLALGVFAPAPSPARGPLYSGSASPRRTRLCRPPRWSRLPWVCLRGAEPRHRRVGARVGDARAHAAVASALLRLPAGRRTSLRRDATNWVPLHVFRTGDLRPTGCACSRPASAPGRRHRPRLFGLVIIASRTCHGDSGSGPRASMQSLAAVPPKRQQPHTWMTRSLIALS